MLWLRNGLVETTWYSDGCVNGVFCELFVIFLTGRIIKSEGVPARATPANWVSVESSCSCQFWRGDYFGREVPAGEKDQ